MTDASAFEQRLWTQAESRRRVSLADAVKTTFKSGQQLAALTLISEGDYPLKRSASARLFDEHEYRQVGSVELMKVADHDGDWFVSTWPTGYLNVYQLVAVIPITDPRWGRFRRWMTGPSTGVQTFLLNEVEWTDRSRTRLGGSGRSRPALSPGTKRQLLLLEDGLLRQGLRDRHIIKHSRRWAASPQFVR